MNNDNNDLPKFNCNQFTSCKDIEDNFPTKKCSECENFEYDNGIATCKLINEL